MSIFSKKTIVPRRFPKIARLAIVGFVMALAYSLIGTVWAVYINSFVNNESLVGFIISGLAVISLLSYIFIVPLVQKSNKSKLFMAALLALSAFYFILSINNLLYAFLIVAFIVTVLATIRATTFGLIVKYKSSKDNLPKNEGIIYTFLNLAWVIGPIIAGVIAVRSGNNLVFLFSSVLLFLCFLLFKISNIKEDKSTRKIEKNIFKNTFDFFRDKDRRVSYLLGGGVNLWWVLVYVFMPIIILKNGLSERAIGFFLFGVSIPLILFEYKFSCLTKKYGFRNLFKIGYLIPAVISIICFLISSVYLILALIILASIGLAMIEPTTEAYFLEIVNKRDELKYYEVYNTSIDLNQFVASFISGVILVFMPLKFLFLLFGILMCIFFIVSFKAKNLKSANKKKRMLDFPILRQVYNYDCGANAVQGVLDYYGIDVREGELMRLTETKRSGTNIHEIKKVLNYFGLRHKEGEMDIQTIKKYINKRIPVILTLQAWSGKKDTNWKGDWSDGHYATVVGYDKKRIYFEDPAAERRTYLSYKELEERWHDTDKRGKKIIRWGCAVYRSKYSKIFPHPRISRDYKKYRKEYRYNENSVIHMD